MRETRGELSAAPAVVVLLATHNGMRWLGEQVDSILGQRDVTVRIHDDGTHQEARRELVGSAQGIRGMKERAALFDGTLYAGPASAGGWSVLAKLKLPHPTRCPEETPGGPGTQTAPKTQHQGS